MILNSKPIPQARLIHPIICFGVEIFPLFSSITISFIFYSIPNLISFILFITSFLTRWKIFMELRIYGGSESIFKAKLITSLRLWNTLCKERKLVRFMDFSTNSLKISSTRSGWEGSADKIPTIKDKLPSSWEFYSPTTTASFLRIS